MTEIAEPAVWLDCHSGDDWVQCGNHYHWGVYGAAGLLLVKRNSHGAPSHMVLQHRTPWSHMGDTWGIPGGALAPHETPHQGALREAREEAGLFSQDFVTIGTHVLEHPAWSYTTVVAQVRPGVDVVPHAADIESLEVRWVAMDELDDLNLLSPFADALPELLQLLPPAA